jgi:predicted nuclease of predicted toxin-antitoxin system
VTRAVRLVADENCDFSVVIDLRAAGYDVVSITEQMAGADDEAVIDFARSERRLLVTEDQGLRTACICGRQAELRSHSYALSRIGSVCADGSPA